MFNEGILLSYAYMTLVLPKETVFKNLCINSIDTTKFQINKDTYNKKNDLVRHIRNALSHGNITIKNIDILTFWDSNVMNSDEEFEADIKFNDFGTFLSDLYSLKKEYFNNDKK
jgi:hypothetical protein